MSATVKLCAVLLGCFISVQCSGVIQLDGNNFDAVSLLAGEQPLSIDFVLSTSCFLSLSAVCQR